MPAGRSAFSPFKPDSTRQVRFEPFADSFLSRLLFERLERVGVAAPPFGGPLHIEDDVVEKVREVEDDLVILLMTARAHLQKRLEQQAMQGDDGRAVGGR